MEKIAIPKDEFRLGVTMAGAVSAGAYTGGVMDYLFEILDLWERAKDGKVKDLENQQSLIPKHKVIIDVMGGTSAGAMATSMSAIYALEGKINPIKTPGNCNEKKNNIFYDSWVLLDDTLPYKNKTGDTFRKVWETSDLEATKSVKSLLNSAVIDRICDSAFDLNKGRTFEDAVNTLPPYISQEMQMLISHCFLHGIPLEVNFETPIAKKGHKNIIPTHTSYEHYIVSHFHLNNGKPLKSDEYLWLNPYDKTASKTMKLATIATGAFPVGLLYREFTAENMSESYLKSILKRILYGKFGLNDPDPQTEIVWRNFPEKFSSLAIDGGTINNEPYREVTSIMKDRYGDPDPEKGYQYGMVMIDPFPDQTNKANLKEPKDLYDVIPQIIGTLKDQSKVKRREMIENITTDFFKGEIFPVKRIYNSTVHGEPIDSPIACASVEAFGGFLDIRFRQHDFFLGRNNARNFFRYWFSLPYSPEKKSPIHEDWTEEMVQCFKDVRKIKNSDGIYEEKIFLPIIPDLNILLEGVGERDEMKKKYTIAEMPKYNPENLFDLKSIIEERFLMILDLTKARLNSKKASDKSIGKDDQSVQLKDHPQAEQWMANKYHENIFKRLAGRFGTAMILMIFNLFKGSIAKKITQKVISKILEDLEEKDLIQKFSGDGE